MSRSGLFPSNRGCQRSQGPTSVFWEVAPGRRPRMWMQRSVTQYQQQQCTIVALSLSPRVPETSAEVIQADSPVPLPTSPPYATPTLVFFLSLRQELDSSNQGVRESQLNLCLPLPPYFFPKNPGLPSKSFLDLFLNLIWLTGKTKIRKAKWLGPGKAATKRLTPRSSLFFGLPNVILMPSPHLPLISCQHRSGKLLRNIYTYIYIYLNTSLVSYWPFSSCHWRMKKARKLTNKALPYSLLSNILILSTKQ